MERYTLKNLVAMLRSRDISSHEILEMYIQRISEHDSSFNSYITLSQDVALEKSIQADRLIESGDPLPLTGIPYAGKDIFCTQGVSHACLKLLVFPSKKQKKTAVSLKISIIVRV